LGEICEEQENDTQALKMYEESLELFSPINDSSTIKISSIIALLNARRDNWQMAEKYGEKTLKGLVHFRLDDPAVLDCYERIGLIYEIQERYTDAQTMYETILSCVSADGQDFPIVPAHIGHLYEKQGNYSASLEVYERLLGIQLNILYRNHPLLADTYTSIARLLYSQHRYEEAYISLVKAIKIDLISMTSNHPWINKRQNEIDAIRQKITPEPNS
jgi:tetratricopeptide (TPR) repeat protein